MLPFSNLFADADQEYFSGGASSDLITHISRPRSLRGERIKVYLTLDCAQRLCTTLTIKPITKAASAAKKTHLIIVGMIFLSSTARTTGTDTAT